MAMACPRYAPAAKSDGVGPHDGLHADHVVASVQEEDNLESRGSQLQPNTNVPCMRRNQQRDISMGTLAGLSNLLSPSKHSSSKVFVLSVYLHLFQVPSCPPPSFSLDSILYLPWHCYSPDDEECRLSLDHRGQLRCCARGSTVNSAFQSSAIRMQWELPRKL